MRFSLSSRQTPEYLRKCDEINVEYNDRNIIPTLVEQYPDKWIKVNTHLVHNIDWKSIDTYNKLTQGKFIISLAFPEGAVECKERNIKFMLGTYIDTFDKLMAAKELGAYEALIGGAICFDIRRASKQGIKLRMCINQAQTDSIPRVNGVVGSWVRPEDLHMYDEFIDIAEIASQTREQERTYYDLYAEKHAWPGQLDMIIQNLNYKGTNRMIPSDFTEKRLQCAQRCRMGIDCHACYRILQLADPDLLRAYRDRDKNN